MKLKKILTLWIPITLLVYYLLVFTHWIGAPFGSDFLISGAGFYFLLLFIFIELLFVTM